MTTKHTPGPWGFQPSSNPRNGTAWRDIVSHGTPFSPSYVGEALEQDARLIAAAPDLLEAASWARDILVQLKDAGHNVEIELNACERAIAKAEGRE